MLAPLTFAIAAALIVSAPAAQAGLAASNPWAALPPGFVALRSRAQGFASLLLMLGLAPCRHHAGGKASLGRITKRGDEYLRTLLIQGAKSAVMSAGKRSDRISLWLAQLKDRVGWQKTVVALANKNARILWAVLTRDVAFDPDHVSAPPPARCALKPQPAA